jgi:hypothetical protein
MMWALELVVLAVDDELVDAVAFVVDGADGFDEVEDGGPLEATWSILGEDGHQRLLVFRT